MLMLIDIAVFLLFKYHVLNVNELHIGMVANEHVSTIKKKEEIFQYLLVVSLRYCDNR